MESAVPDMTSYYNNLRDRLMALDIDDAGQAAADAVHNEYEQELVTQNNSLNDCRTLCSSNRNYERSDPLAKLAGCASNTPQAGRQLQAERQPTSSSEMPPSPPQSPPPVPHAETSGDTNESVTGALGALLSAFFAQVSSVNTVLPKWRGRCTRIISVTKKTTGQTGGSSPL